MRDKSRGDSLKNGKTGYRPLNEGYSPKDERGYAGSSLTGKLPKAPKGGTGQTIFGGTSKTGQITKK
jgi:hypothetical protein